MALYRNGPLTVMFTQAFTLNKHYSEGSKKKTNFTNFCRPPTTFLSNDDCSFHIIHSNEMTFSTTLIKLNEMQNSQNKNISMIFLTQNINI